MQRRDAIDDERDIHLRHAVPCRPGAGIRVDCWSGGLLLVRADREGTAWMP